MKNNIYRFIHEYNLIEGPNRIEIIFVNYIKRVFNNGNVFRQWYCWWFCLTLLKILWKFVITCFLTQKIKYFFAINQLCYFFRFNKDSKEMVKRSIHAKIIITKKIMWCFPIEVMMTKDGKAFDIRIRRK